MLRSALRNFKSSLHRALDALRRWLCPQERSPIEQVHSRLFPPIGTLSRASKQELEQRLGFPIRKAPYYEQALLHRSALHRFTRPGVVSNERLEFLGDALLGFLTAEYLFERYPELPEGELTKMRTWLVNRRTLAICARKLTLERWLTASPSARHAIERGSDAPLADALEALIAAVYLDHGLEAARALVRDRLLPIAEEEHLLQDTNYKSLLLEYLQARGEAPPQYRVLSERGPAHAKEFVVGVYVGEHCLGVGRGRSKKEAEQHAARKALMELERVNTDTDHDGAPHL